MNGNPDPKRHPQNNNSLTTQTHNVITDDFGNINGTNQGGDCDSLIGHGLFPKEKKMPYRESETRESYYTLKEHILKKTKTRRKILPMVCIDNNKAYGLALQSWIIYCHNLYKISGRVIKFIKNTMKNWRVELTAGGKSLTEEKIQKVIFQGHLL